MSNSLKGTLLTVVAGSLGVVRNEWPIPNGTRNFGSGLDQLASFNRWWNSHALGLCYCKG